MANASSADRIEKLVARHEAAHAISAVAAGLHRITATIERDGTRLGVTRFHDFSIKNCLALLTSGPGSVLAVRHRIRIALAGRAAEELYLRRAREPMSTRMHTRGDQPDRDVIDACDWGFRIRSTVLQVERLLDAEDLFIRKWLTEQRQHVEHYAAILLSKGSIYIRPIDALKIPRWPRPRWAPTTTKTVRPTRATIAGATQNDGVRSRRRSS